jgi:hypothetical protein
MSVLHSMTASSKRRIENGTGAPISERSHFANVRSKRVAAIGIPGQNPVRIATADRGKSPPMPQAGGGRAISRRGRALPGPAHRLRRPADAWPSRLPGAASGSARSPVSLTAVRRERARPVHLHGITKLRGFGDLSSRTRHAIPCRRGQNCRSQGRRPDPADYCVRCFISALLIMCRRPSCRGQTITVRNAVNGAGPSDMARRAGAKPR